MAASCRVASNAMEAPTGPDGVRPCDCTGTAEPTSKASENHRPAICMAAIIPKAAGGHQLALGVTFHKAEWNHFPNAGAPFC